MMEAIRLLMDVKATNKNFLVYCYPNVLGNKWHMRAYK